MSEQIVSIEVDGEPLGVLPVEIEVAPAAIRAIVPA
jgi:diacylglycerol kinase family enzyme